MNAAAVYNGELYIGGVFDTAGGQPASSIAKWNGSAWATVGTGIAGYTQYGSLDSGRPLVNAMTVYNGELYVLGNFTSAGGVTANNIAKWNGTAWSAVGGGLATGQNATSDIVSLAVANGLLYASGDFNNASGVAVNNIASWNGTAWSAVGTGLGTDTPGRGSVAAMTEYQGALYAAYDYSDQSGDPVYSLSKWDGSSWTGVVGGVGTGLNYSGYIFSLLPSGGNLVAAGEFPVIGNDSTSSGLAQYNGSSWSEVGSGTDTSFYYRLVNYNSHLYVGGFFVEIGGTPVVNLAEYSCVTSSINEVSASHVNVYPNPGNGVVTISLENVPTGAGVQVYNLMGEKVSQALLSGDKTELNLTGQTAGTYLYRIATENGEAISSGSFMIR